MENALFWMQAARLTGALLVMVAICIFLTKLLLVKCPRCGKPMVYNNNGYDKWDCLHCGYCGKP